MNKQNSFDQPYVEVATEMSVRRILKPHKTTQLYSTSRGKSGNMFLQFG